MTKNTPIKNLWTLVCKSSSIDNETNNVTLFNVIEEIGFLINPVTGNALNFAEKKTIPLDIELISLWKRGSSSGNLTADVKIELLDPKNVVMQEIPYKIEFKPQHERMRTRIRISSINVTSQGEYNFSILLKEQGGKSFVEVARAPIVIKISIPSNLG